MSMKLKVWLVTIGEILPVAANVRKMRTNLLADKLAEKGHEVIWWASAFDHFRKDWLFKKDTDLAVNKNLKIRALKGTGYRKNISLTRLIDHRVIARKFRKSAQTEKKPHVIIASLPTHDLAYEAAIFAKENNIPLLVDIRDPWPDIYWEVLPKGFKTLAKLALHGDFRMMKTAVKKADGLLAPTDTFLKWGLRHAGREMIWKDRVFPIGYKRNSPSAEGKKGRITGRFGHLMAALKDSFIVFFVGTISRSYHNPLIMLEAAKRLTDFKDIHFIIAGDGELFRDLKEASRNLDNVTLTGWLDEEEIAFFLRYSKVGICPAAKPVDLPTNKAYAYLSQGLPVISSFHGDLKGLIEKYGIGLYYPPRDADSLAGSIKKIYQDPDLYRNMSENALYVFDEMFDAEKIYDEYASHIEKIVEDKKGIINLHKIAINLGSIF